MFRLFRNIDRAPRWVPPHAPRTVQQATGRDHRLGTIKLMLVNTFTEQVRMVMFVALTRGTKTPLDSIDQIGKLHGLIFGPYTLVPAIERTLRLVPRLGAGQPRKRGLPAAPFLSPNVRSMLSVCSLLERREEDGELPRSIQYLEGFRRLGFAMGLATIVHVLRCESIRLCQRLRERSEAQ